MEKQLFDWEEWSEVEILVIQYFNCTLKKDIGKYKKNDIIKIIVMDYDSGTMQFYKESTLLEEFNLRLEVNPMDPVLVEVHNKIVTLQKHFDAPVGALNIQDILSIIMEILSLLQQKNLNLEPANVNPDACKNIHTQLAAMQQELAVAKTGMGTFDINKLIQIIIIILQQFIPTPTPAPNPAPMPQAREKDVTLPKTS